MESLLNTANNMSTLAFLRVLQLVHVQTAGQVDDLRAYEPTSSVPRSPSDNAEVRKSLGLPASISGSSVTSSGAAVSGSVPLSTMLETSFEELFVPYTEGARYLEKETKNIGELYMNFLGRFTRYHVYIWSLLNSMIY